MIGACDFCGKALAIGDEVTVGLDSHNIAGYVCDSFKCQQWIETVLERFKNGV
jgi:hypothetical protein